MGSSIEVLKKVSPQLSWYPQPGSNFSAFAQRKRTEGEVAPNELEVVLHEAQVILGRSVDPKLLESASNTGLVIGYVQSGKTMSFTAVTALARDCGYGLVILLAGTQTNLKDQSEERLEKDLGLDDESFARQWRHFSNPTLRQSEDIQNSLQMWGDPDAPPNFRRAVLITVLKNTTRLNGLVSVLQKLKMTDVPALVIDDEADQASLNTKARKGGASPTYQSLLQIKATLPNHTLLQYTATPQANLLISIYDALSPDFCEFITPGKGYVGGKTFFARNSPYIETISASDQDISLEGGVTPPESLLNALKIFLLGIAFEATLERISKRSMMIHPSQPTSPDGHFSKWVRNSLNGWRSFYERKEAKEFLLEDFAVAHEKLSKTIPELPPLGELIQKLKYLIPAIKVEEINRSGREDVDFDWKKADYWILIGGQKLDRGFTVKGLTVTYMPRSLGTGNADTLQQRARFFGYKEKYLGLCRAFVVQEVKSAFEDYVLHEEDIRAELKEVQGKPLKEWYRKFFLPTGLNPTRANVLSVPFRRLSVLPDRWIKPSRLHVGPSVQQRNIDLVKSTRDSWARDFGVEDAGNHQQFTDKRVDSPRNLLVEPVPLRRIYEDLFLNFRVVDSEEAEQRIALLKVIFQRIEDGENDVGSVFIVGSLTPAKRSGGKSFELFQGYVPKGAPPTKRTYVGDAQLYDPSRFTLHLRMLSVSEENQSPQLAAWYAVRLPDNWSGKDILFRDREGKQ